MPHGAKIVDAMVLRLFFAYNSQQQPADPKFEPGDEAITRGGIGCLGSLVYICGYMRPACMSKEYGCGTRQAPSEICNYPTKLTFMQDPTFHMSEYTDF